MRPLFFSIQLLACSGLIFSSALLADTASAARPSFDCAKADHEAEKLVCGDDKLAALDNQLAAVYHAAYQNFPTDERKKQKAIQRGWIKGRNDCWKSDDLLGCVKNVYQTRITELQIQGGLVTVPEAVNFQCNGGEYDYLTAIFYQNTILPVVVLTRINGKESWQSMAYHVPSGSGAKYEGQNVLFWNKGSEAMVEWNGAKLKCKEMSTGE